MGSKSRLRKRYHAAFYLLLILVGFACIIINDIETADAWTPPSHDYAQRAPYSTTTVSSSKSNNGVPILFSSRRPPSVRTIKAASSSELRDERKRTTATRNNKKSKRTTVTSKGEPTRAISAETATKGSSSNSPRKSTTKRTTKSNKKKTAAAATKTYAANGAVSRIFHAAARASKLAQDKRQRQQAAAAAAATKSTLPTTRDIQIPTPSTYPPRMASLTDLTKAIDQQLLLAPSSSSSSSSSPGSANHHYSVQNRSARDSMTAVVKYNLQQESSSDEHYRQVFLMRRPKTVVDVKHVAVVFGKDLLMTDDQMGVDYAGRIRRLVRAMKREDFHPDVICFLLHKIGGGGVVPSDRNNNKLRQQQQHKRHSSISGIAASDVGYVFFRHLCAAQGVSLPNNIAFYIQHPESSMQDDDNHESSPTIHNYEEERNYIGWIRGGEEYIALQRMVQHLQTECLPSWLTDLVRNQQQQQKEHQDKPRPEKLRIQFSLFSSDYHLCQLHDTHLKSPDQSPFRALQLRNRDTSWSASVRGLFPATTSNNSANHHLLETRWTYFYATTVPVLATDPASAFFFKVFRTAQQLRPILLNLAAVVENREFFQQENYLVLVSARRSLVADMESIYQAQPSLKAVHRIRAGSSAADKTGSGGKGGGGGGVPADVVLESALLSLGRCLDLVRPAGLLTGTVSRDDYKLASRVLKQAVDQISITCDPDKVLEPGEWGKLGDESDNVNQNPEQDAEDDEAALLLHNKNEQELSCEVHLDDEGDEEDE